MGWFGSDSESEPVVEPIVVESEVIDAVIIPEPEPEAVVAPARARRLRKGKASRMAAAQVKHAV